MKRYQNKQNELFGGCRCNVTTCILKKIPTGMSQWKKTKTNTAQFFQVEQRTSNIMSVHKAGTKSVSCRVFWTVASPTARTSCFTSVLSHKIKTGPVPCSWSTEAARQQIEGESSSLLPSVSLSIYRREAGVGLEATIWRPWCASTVSL